MADNQHEQKFIWVCDPGSTHLTIMAGCTDEKTGELSLLGSTSVPNSGVKRGMVIDLEALTNAVQDATDEVESQTGLTMNEVRVCVSNPCSLFENIQEKMVLKNGEVKEADVEKLVTLARNYRNAQNYECIHSLVGLFEVDKKKQIANPTGLFGSQLLLNHHKVQLPISDLKSMSRGFERAGIKVKQFVFEPLAAAEAIILPEEKEFGCVVINLGATQTHIAVYHQHVPIYCASLPVASMHITKDLAIGLRTTITHAEKLKREVASVLSDKESDYDLIEIAALDATTTHRIYRSEINKIVEARVREIFENVLVELKKMRLVSTLGNSIVLTGGGASIKGLVPFVEKVFNTSTRLGAPKYFPGVTEMLTNPGNSSCLGLFSHIFQDSQTWLTGGHELQKRATSVIKYPGIFINKLIDTIF